MVTPRRASNVAPAKIRSWRRPELPGEVVEELRALRLRVLKCDSDQARQPEWERLVALMAGCRAAGWSLSDIGTPLKLSSTTVARWLSRPVDPALRRDVPAKPWPPRRTPRKTTYPVRLRVTDQELADLKALWEMAGRTRGSTPAGHPNRLAGDELCRRAYAICTEREVSVYALSITLGQCKTALRNRLTAHGYPAPYPGRQRYTGSPEGNSG